MSAPARILVADDSPDNRDLLVQWLEREGHVVVEARDGYETIAAIERQRPDLLLLDLMMPGLDGFGVLNYLKGTPEPFLPVVVISAASERESRLKALKQGAHEFVAKPVDGEELGVRVATLLELKRQRDRSDALMRELQNHNARLEGEVERRTATLADANDQLQRADIHKDEFLSVISHELRTPLNFIMGFASILEDELQGPLTDDQRVSVSRILAGAERMLALVNDLLEFARLRSGKQPLELSPTAVRPLVNDAVASLAPLAAEKHIDLSCEAPSDTIVHIDSPRIMQALTNLVGNAIKFTPEGGAVTVRASIGDQELRCEVEDTGIGIAEEDLERVFERFWQADMGNTRTAGGTGLGLSITRALIEAHGGTLRAVSELGHGSTFWFTIPTTQERLEEALGALASPPSGAA